MMEEKELVPSASERSAPEQELARSMEEELTDDQLLQMAEGGCSWGASCNKQGGC
jgi:hypothetical protein